MRDREEFGLENNMQILSYLCPGSGKIFPIHI